MALVIADDHERERSWIKSLMAENFAELLPIFEAKTGQEAVELVLAYKPVIAFLDLEMPVLSGIKATAKILESCPQTGIVIISNHANEIWVRQLWKIMPSEGAFAYCLKDSTDKQIIEATQNVLNGDCWIHPKIQRVLFKGNDGSTLSNGEFEVLAYICLGLTDKAIARRLFLTEKAIQARLKAVYSKLGMPLRGTTEEDEYNHRCRAINVALRKKLINTAQLDEWEQNFKVEAL